MAAVLNYHGSKYGAMTGMQHSSLSRSGPGSRDVMSGPGLYATCRLRHVLRAWALRLVLMLLAVQAAGCQNWFRPVEWPELGSRDGQQRSPYRVVPKQSMSTASLVPDDIVAIMRRIGFMDEQVLELGTDLHNALRFTGAAEIFYNKEKLAIFIADGSLVRVRSKMGSADYDVANHRFVSPGQTEE
ncbi:MAG: hypothetical protein KBE65_07445 [Phycisphaerae bacterium]|nr:hypothetical protein [Phycisphaerae bacterium]